MPRRAEKPQDEFLKQMRTILHQWDKGDPSSFGISKAQHERLRADYAAARAAADKAADLAKQLRAANAAKRAALSDLRRTFGGLSTIIDGLARASRDAGVYPRAGLKPPKRKGPLPGPAAPTGLKVTPRENGSVELRFEIADKGRGNLMYEVQRRCQWPDGRRSDWEQVQVASGRKVLDEDVPQGLQLVAYRVRALRTNGKMGAWSKEKIFPFGAAGSAKGSAMPKASAEPRARAQVEGKPAGAAIAGKPV